MDKKDQAMQLLKECLDEIPSLRRQAYDSSEYKLWYEKTEIIIKEAFDSADYNRFQSVRPVYSGFSEFTLQRKYREQLRHHETALKAIIQKYELRERLGSETEIIITSLKDTTEVAIHLFDRMQFHPRVIEASRELFEDGYYRDAILRTFIEINNFVKEKTSLELDGKALMAQVFNKDNPVIKLNELRNRTEKDEQEGFMFLFMGAMVGIRNPKAHDNVIQTDPFRTLEYLGFASLLMKRIEEGILVKTSPPRKKWNLQRFLADTRERCKQEVVDTITKLYDFTKSNSDSISWGTGSYWGSFTFRKSGHGITASIFTVYSDSSLTINFGQMKGREIKEEALESLRVELNRIPEIKIPRDAVNIGKWHDISVEPLMNAENLNKFQEAVLSLCKNIESGGDK